PFGELGAVYLELHDDQEIPAGLSVSDLYADTLSAAASTYWNGDGANDSYEIKHPGWRTTITTYDSGYTFTGLDPGKTYWVVMAHVTEKNGAFIRTLDDYTKASTNPREDSMSITPITDTSVTVNFSLSQTPSYAGTPTLQLVGADGNPYTGDMTVSLSDAEIAAAVDGGYSYTFNTGSYTDTESGKSGTAALGVVITAELSYTDGAEKRVVLTTWIMNRFNNET
ncbi:MAG: hypothetical protein IJQ98_01090, partial [Oscillospiraceae bacterium]|nr:hypothetical protein [Oscillospiraceae bacterium]